MFVAITGLLVAALAGAPVDVKGKWEGTLTGTRPDGTTSADGALMILDQKDTKITGTLGGNEGDQHPITSGTIDGTKVSLTAKHSESGREYHLELTIQGDEMKGTVKSGERTGQVHVKRRKP